MDPDGWPTRPYPVEKNAVYLRILYDAATGVITGVEEMSQAEFLPETMLAGYWDDDGWLMRFMEAGIVPDEHYNASYDGHLVLGIFDDLPATPQYMRTYVYDTETGAPLLTHPEGIYVQTVYSGDNDQIPASLELITEEAFERGMQEQAERYAQGPGNG
ncbi:hypothetical protein LJC74_07430 [Eubacteriales bacterium OttesenSCG-928-A19]|nr:hypothetical protein [Eubacteriales bacterium OttesenSCG-928-A19]